MYSFVNDYSEGAHPKIMELMMSTNLTQTPGYGLDPYCEKAASLIRKAIGIKTVDIHFLVGGTQTNATAISAFLRPYEACVCVSTGHINVHETGAIEATGHKVLTRTSADGKLTVEKLNSVVMEHPDEHMVKPRLVYLSQATEVGTYYTRAELTAISEYCKAHDLILYLDGARLGSGLTAAGCDLTLQDLAQLTDAFYIGGTKNGALFGEALVIVNDALKKDFRYSLKQKGGMLAKGRLLGIQFAALFTDDLYFEIGRQENALAMKLKNGIASFGYRFLFDSETNQQFPIFPNEILAKLQEQFGIGFWETIDENHTAVRMVTSFATPEPAVDEFLQALSKLSK